MTTAHTPRRVLVVDDNRDAALTLSMLLELSGHSTRVAHDATQALAAAETFAPEVAVLDIGLPGLSGLELSRRLRASPVHARMVLIALTGWGQAADRRATAQAGFDLHLVKPVDPEALLSQLELIAARRNAPQGSI